MFCEYHWFTDVLFVLSSKRAEKTVKWSCLDAVSLAQATFLQDIQWKSAIIHVLPYTHIQKPFPINNFSFEEPLTICQFHSSKILLSLLTWPFIHSGEAAEMQIHFAGAQEVLQTTRSSNQNLEVTIFAHEPWTPTSHGSMRWLRASKCKMHESIFCELGDWWSRILLYQCTCMYTYKYVYIYIYDMDK